MFGERDSVPEPSTPEHVDSSRKRPRQSPLTPRTAPFASTSSTNTCKTAASARQLRFSEHSTARPRRDAWTLAEDQALVEYIALYGDDLCDVDSPPVTSPRWPGTKDLSFWNRAADYVSEQTPGKIRRSGEMPH